MKRDEQIDGPQGQHSKGAPSQAVQEGRPARPQRAKRRGVPLRYVEPLSDARTKLAGFFNSLLGFGLDTFNIQPNLDLVADDEPTAI